MLILPYMSAFLCIVATYIFTKKHSMGGYFSSDWQVEKDRILTRNRIVNTLGYGVVTIAMAMLLVSYIYS